MTQENPRYLSVVRNGQIECARGTRGLRKIVDPVRLWVAARKMTLKMVQPCCSMQWLPHGVACVGENIIGTFYWSHPYWEHTAVFQGVLLDRREPARVLTVSQACIFGYREGRLHCCPAPTPLHLWAALEQRGATAHPNVAGFPSQVPQRSSLCATKCSHRWKPFPLNSWLFLWRPHQLSQKYSCHKL